MRQPKVEKADKYLYLHVLQGNYGQGWEDICQSTDRREMEQDQKSYQENAPEYSYRIVQRRERI